jgi:hypothetical protein
MKRSEPILEEELERMVFAFFTSLIGCPMTMSKQSVALYMYLYIYYVKAMPLQALTGPEVFKRLRFPDFKKIGT